MVELIVQKVDYDGGNLRNWDEIPIEKPKPDTDNPAIQRKIESMADGDSIFLAGAGLQSDDTKLFLSTARRMGVLMGTAKTRGANEGVRITRIGNKPRSAADQRFEEFLAAFCVIDAAERVRTHTLDVKYASWVQQVGEPGMTKLKFGKKLTDRGFALDVSTGRAYRLGLRLKKDSELEAEKLAA